MDEIKLPSDKALRLTSIVTVLLTGVMAVANTPLRDVPVIWYEKDRSDSRELAERDPNLLWDEIDDTAFLPLARLLNPARLIRSVGTVFGGDHVTPAANVNSLDEVPNSTWFTNRIGLFPIDAEEIATGPGSGTGPDRGGKWTIVSAKTQGVTPGFNIRDIRGDTYLIKFDPPGFLGMTSGAGVISGRILHAAGYNVPDDAVVIFRRDDLIIGDDVKVKVADGTKRLMTNRDLEEILRRLDTLPDGHFLAIASKFISGRPLGPFNYMGRRKDDSNDQIDHQNRRELRGFRVFAAWLAHFDTKQHNSLDVLVSENGRRFVRHYLIDFASTLGAGANGPCQRYSFEYTVDFAAILGRVFALGFHEDAWRRLSRPKGLDEIGYFESREFEPMTYRPLQPNTAFANLTDRDGYWAAKIISAFSDEHLEAIVQCAQYRNSEATRYMARILGERRDKIAHHFFQRIPPLDFFLSKAGGITFHDLATERGICSTQTTRYRSRFRVVNERRAGPPWSPWVEFEERMVPLDSGPAHEILKIDNSFHYPFLAVELQVNRGTGWSNSVKAYMARRSKRIAAVER